MRQPRKQTKGKSKDRTPKTPPPVTQKPLNTKLMLRVPPLSSATTQVVPPTRTPEFAQESSPLQPDEDIPVDSDIFRDMPELPYIASPRQQINDHFWDTWSGDSDVVNVTQKEDLPNQATSHPENDLGLALPGAGGKRKASMSTHSLERRSSVNDLDSDDSNLPDSPDSDPSTIQAAVSKKAQKTPREPIEIEDTDEELDKVVQVTKGRKGRKLSKKERMRNDRESDEEEEGSYKNST